MMKLIMERLKNTWKIVASLVFCVLFFTTCKNAYANETNAGLCNGAWGIVGGYYCDILPIGGGQVLCVFFGRDNDRNGVYRSGTSDQCIVNGGGSQKSIDCNEMCRLNNNCSRVQCPVGKQLDDVSARLNALSRATGNDLTKSP
ncbi:TPA: hypothetical protein SAN82_001214 [Pseudomonas putida]|nr:hypothetical protein [Pseudomonas putida]